MSETFEEWRVVPDLKTHEVSSLGSIRRKLDRKMVRQHDHKGYRRVSINGKGHLVHRLVARAFLGDGTDKTVNHIDCNKANNVVVNLEWCTHQENIRHATKMGRMKRKKPLFGKDAPNAKYSEADVTEVRRMWSNGKTLSQIGKKLNMKRGTAWVIAIGRTWKNI